MAATIHVDVVSAEESIFSGEAKFVALPGEAGELGILPRHTPLITRIKPGAVRIVRAETKTQILGGLADCFAEVYGLDREVVLERIEERETLGSTGFGRGVAIPHARLEGLARPVAAFFRLESPVEFASSDGMLVDCVFGLLSPEQAGATHLQALAAISRLMRDERMHERLIAAPDADAIYALLVNVIDRDAA